ncbi:MAG: hypothetical protein ACKVX7_05655 [Planctomycetota bacterium]
MATKLEFTNDQLAAYRAASEEFLNRTQKYVDASQRVGESGARQPPLEYSSQLEYAIRQMSLVHAVGLGHRVVDGLETDEVSIRLYVTQRPPDSLRRLAERRGRLPEHLRDFEPLPFEYHGVPTSVIQRPLARPLQANGSALSVEGYLVDVQPSRIITPGTSIGHQTNSGGTIACLCRPYNIAPLTSGVYVLSAYHVLGDMSSNPLDRGQVVQPGSGFGGPQNSVASFCLIRGTELPTNGGGGPMLCDAAIAEVNNDVAFDPRLPGIGNVRGTSRHVQNQPVSAIGATTSKTSGSVFHEWISILLPFWGFSVILNDQFSITMTAQGGDSGALVVSDIDYTAVGLLVAANDTLTFATPIATIEKELNIALTF